MGQQSGLVEHQRAHRFKIIDGGFVSEGLQRHPRGAVAQLRFVAQREKGLGAAGGGPGARDFQHLVGGWIGGSSRAGPLGEAAIVADIAAKMRERNKHLPRIRDAAAMALVAQASRRVDQLRERGLFKPRSTVHCRSNRASRSPYEAVRHDPRHVGRGPRMMSASMMLYL